MRIQTQTFLVVSLSQNSYGEILKQKKNEYFCCLKCFTFITSFPHLYYHCLHCSFLIPSTDLPYLHPAVLAQEITSTFVFCILGLTGNSDTHACSVALLHSHVLILKQKLYEFSKIIANCHSILNRVIILFIIP